MYLKKRIEDRIGRDTIAFLMSSVFVGIVFGLSPISGDDLHYYEMNKSLHELMQHAIDLYNTWSSRVIINALWFFILKLGPIAFALYMGICVFAMQKALSILFIREKNKICSLFIMFIVLLFPFSYLSSAGWIATATCYFGPQALGMLGLVPIRKVFDHKKMSKGEIFLYALCIIYSANEEQMMLVLLGSYLIALIALWIHRQNSKILLFMLALIVISAIIVFTCPGNITRRTQEIRWFKSYDMLSIIDKGRMGVGRTLNWIFYSGQFLTLVVCVLLFFAVLKRCKDMILIGISGIPLVCVLLFGVFKNNLSILFPQTANIAQAMPYYGYISVQNRSIIGFVGLLVLAVLVCAEVILASKNMQELVINLALIFLGAGSSIALAFSPTIYASDLRTMTTLATCMIAVASQVFCSNIEEFSGNMKRSTLLGGSLVVFICLMLVELLLRIVAN